VFHLKDKFAAEKRHVSFSPFAFEELALNGTLNNYYPLKYHGQISVSNLELLS
jgi:hypothetical protein